MQAAINNTRFLPSSTSMSLAYSPFIRYTRICFFISNFGSERFGFALVATRQSAAAAAVNKMAITSGETVCTRSEARKKIYCTTFQCFVSKVATANWLESFHGSH